VPALVDAIARHMTAVKAAVTTAGA